MSNNPNFYRNDAEAQLALEGLTPVQIRSAEELLHELRVHQIELEMQNEALRQSQIALEESRDRYFNLYEFAPVSYITLSQTGQIAEINLTGAMLLGENRNKLIKQRFSRYIFEKDRNRWEKFFLNSFKDESISNCDLRGKRKDGLLFNAYLDSRIIKTGDVVSGLHVTLTDITQQKKIETAQHQFELRLVLLSRREKEVLALALTGLPNKEIATHLEINQRTVENHRAKIHKKIGVDSLLELAQLATLAEISLADIAPSSK